MTIQIAPTKLALYFGYGRGGHFLRDGGNVDSCLYGDGKEYPGFPWDIGLLDTGLLKNRKVPDRPDGRVHWTAGGTPLWLALAWWDRSGDKRSNSNSGFYVQGFSHLEVQAALDFAREQWPDVDRRQAFPPVLEPH